MELKKHPLKDSNFIYLYLLIKLIRNNKFDFFCLFPPLNNNSLITISYFDNIYLFIIYINNKFNIFFYNSNLGKLKLYNKLVN